MLHRRGFGLDRAVRYATTRFITGYSTVHFRALRLLTISPLSARRNATRTLTSSPAHWSHDEHMEETVLEKLSQTQTEYLAA